MPRFNELVAKVVLEKVLKRKRISKYQFGKLIDVPSSNVAKYFKSGYDPRLSTLERWARALGVSVKDLIDD